MCFLYFCTLPCIYYLHFSEKIIFTLFTDISPVNKQTMPDAYVGLIFVVSLLSSYVMPKGRKQKLSQC